MISSREDPAASGTDEDATPTGLGTEAGFAGVESGNFGAGLVADTSEVLVPGRLLRRRRVLLDF